MVTWADINYIFWSIDIRGTSSPSFYFAVPSSCIIYFYVPCSPFSHSIHCSCRQSLSVIAFEVPAWARSCLCSPVTLFFSPKSPWICNSVAVSSNLPAAALKHALPLLHLASLSFLLPSSLLFFFSLFSGSLTFTASPLPSSSSPSVSQYLHPPRPSPLSSAHYSFLSTIYLLFFYQAALCLPWHFIVFS